jgi:AraC family transcriptional regulator
VTRVTHRDARPPRWLTRVTERLAADGPEPSVRQLAREAGVHPVHVARACALLLSNRVSIAEAAAAAGFADQSHLTRALKSVLGETPAAFRRAGA